MKTTTNLMFAAATLLAAAATLSAETLKAEIPFNFAAGATRLQSGAYSVKVSSTNSGRPMLQIRNLDDRTSILASPLTVAPATDKQADGKAVLSFQCTDGRCELAKIWDGSAHVYTFATSKPGANTHIATVALQSDRGN